MLRQYSCAVDAVIMRHETRYDLLSEFTSAHLAWLKPVAIEATQSASKEDSSILSSTQTFIKDRAIYKRDYVDASMCLVCDDKMVQTLSRNLKMERTASAQNGSPSKVDNNVLGTSTSGSGTSENPRPELLVGNLCLVRGLCLRETARAYHWI